MRKRGQKTAGTNLSLLNKSLKMICGKLKNRLIFSLMTIAAVIVPLLLMGGCATRGDVNEIITDLDELRNDYDQIAESSVTQDSLSREQLKVLRDIFTDVNYTLDQLLERMSIIEGKLDDLTMSASPRTYQGNIVQMPAEQDSVADTTMTQVEISAKQLYDTAYMDFIKGDYKLALSGFREFRTANQKHPLADNALFLMGECHFNLQNYNNATTSYTYLLEHYPRSEKVPDALLRMVEISMKRKDRATANRYFDKLEESFPNSPQTERAAELLGRRSSRM
ncbi:MAG: tetratricopeptide repeat protein [candidate division Zixibacteria bacterium]|nr:tetratricopeptide repeat protein [candidate division Zixibacteria bacterium]